MEEIFGLHVVVVQVAKVRKARKIKHKDFLAVTQVDVTIHH